MQTPFPGMDPWLEHPVLRPDVHNSLIAALRDAVEPVVPLNQIMHDLYTRARFDLQIDYMQPAVPPLSKAQAHSAHTVLAQR